jgi:hypothetical protein
MWIPGGTKTLALQPLDPVTKLDVTPSTKIDAPTCPRSKLKIKM